MIYGLHYMDWMVLFIYLAVIVMIGVYSARLVKNLSDFIMPRRSGKWLMMMFAFGTGTHSDQAVSVASKTYTNGLSGIWYQWLNLFATPFYWLIAPLMRRFRANTTSDVFDARFGKSVAMLFAFWGTMTLMVDTAVMLKGSGAVIDASTGGAFPSNYAIAVMTVMFLVYGMAGGLSAAIITDFIQGILTIVFSIMLVPFIMDAVGGLPGLHQKIQDPEMFSLVAPAEIGLFYIVVIALNALVGIVAQPPTLGMGAAGKTEMDGRWGMTFGHFIKRAVTIAWCLTGLAAVAYFAGRPDVNPDNVYGMVAHEFLPKVAPGLLGVFLASLLASVMSTCDANMISSSGLFAQNLYKPLMPGRSERHYVTVVRVASLLVVAGSVLVAFWLPSVIAGLELFWKVNAMMGIVFWMGLFWRRATVAGAWAAFIAAILALIVSGQGFFVEIAGNLPLSDTLRFVIEKTAGPEVYLPWQMIFYLVAGIGAGVITSFLTRPVDEEKVDRFYALTRTPVLEGEEFKAPCELPDGVEPAPDRKLFPNTGLELQVPSRVSIIGFLGSWVFVAGIIYAFYLIAAS
jgi:Na+/proline symporter